MATTVAVLGGGVGGLSAAHELAERGFSVTVYEKRSRCGGKARSYPTPDGFPAEHGFRFFPGFYRHLPDTMARIPHDGARVVDRLVGAERILLARAGGENEIIAPAHAPESLDDLRVLARFVYDAATSIGVPAADVAWLIERLFTLLTSCDERRFEQWDRQSWWAYVQADKRSEAFRKFLADGLTRTLVAARATEMSARTGGLILVQILLDLARAGARADRVLDAPTSDAWIDPWRAHLAALGVTFRLDAPVEGLRVRNGRIASATVAGAEVTADFYVAALPVEVMRTLLSPELRRAAPTLNGLDRLVTRWMNGILLLPARRPAAGPRARDLHGLRVGADLDLATPVLAHLPGGDRRHPLDRHLRVAARGAPHRQGRGRRARPRRSARRSGGSCTITSRARSTGSRSSPGSSTRRSASRTPRAP